MANPSGFLEHKRLEVPHRPVDERVKDYLEVDVRLPEELLRQQAERCMDCGIPFCHGIGCPVHNRIPEFNDLVHQGRWREACDNLHSTNNFPEITGRICPAPCEASCTLNINDDPVLIRHIELQIVQRGFEEGWVCPRPAKVKTGKHVAIAGSGPAGLAAAQQLARAGYDVSVFEKDPLPGGLLRYGIPDFKLPKSVLDRRLEQMRAEGVDFRNSTVVGEDISLRYLRNQFDAVCLTLGARKPRDLDVPGRSYENICFAMDYLTQQNHINSGVLDAQQIPREDRIDAAGKVVVVIGGGDTGSDCVGTALRQGAKAVHQLEILPKPPEGTNPNTPWPQWPKILRTSTSQEEGCQRRWCVMTRQLTGVGKHVSQLHGCEVQWSQQPDGGWRMSEIEGTDFTMDVDLVLLAMGFSHVALDKLAETGDFELDKGGNLRTDESFMTSVPGVFAAGDAVRGASLIVHAIRSGRDMAAAVDQWLKES